MLIFVLFLFILALRLFERAVLGRTNAFDVVPASEQKLAAKIAKLALKAESLDAPSTFPQWAKVMRERAKLEKKLQDSEDSRRSAKSKEKAGALRSYAVFVSKRGLLIELVVAILLFNLQSATDGGDFSASLGLSAEVSSVQEHALWPFGRALSLPFGGAGVTLMSAVVVLDRGVRRVV